MQLFLSWSGERSQAVASALHDWIPTVLQQVRPWFSSEDIGKGARWLSEISGQLQQQNAGIICVTRENMERPWLLFEAGALSKALEAAAVCPLLFDLEPSDLTGPLSQFQVTRANRNELFRLVSDLNKRSGQPVQPTHLQRVFDALWPDLEKLLAGIRSTPGTKAGEPQRSTEAMVKELLERVRGIERRLEGEVDSRLVDLREVNRFRREFKAISDTLEGKKAALKALPDDHPDVPSLLAEIGQLEEVLAAFPTMSPVSSRWVRTFKLAAGD